MIQFNTKNIIGCSSQQTEQLNCGYIFIKSEHFIFGRQCIRNKSDEIVNHEGDIEKSIANLKLAMDKNYIIDVDYKTQPMYKDLRQHSDWTEIVAESGRRPAIQWDIYLKLIADEETTAL